MKFITIIATLALCIGCATAYQPRGITGGFSDRQVADNEFIIEFAGNGHTTQDRAMEFTVMRSADICVQHGYNFFKFIGEKVEISTSYCQHPGSASTFGSFSKRRYYSSTTYTAPSVTEIRQPTATARIQCYVAMPEFEVLDLTVFDARAIKARGIKKYGNYILNSRKPRKA